MGARLRACDHIRVVVGLRDASQDLQCRRAQVDDLGTRLAIREPEGGILDIDVVPPQSKNFRQAATGQAPENDY